MEHPPNRRRRCCETNKVSGHPRPDKHAILAPGHPPCFRAPWGAWIAPAVASFVYIDNPTRRPNSSARRVFTVSRSACRFLTDFSITFLAVPHDPLHAGVTTFNHDQDSLASPQDVDRASRLATSDVGASRQKRKGQGKLGTNAGSGSSPPPQKCRRPSSLASKSARATPTGATEKPPVPMKSFMFFLKSIREQSRASHGSASTLSKAAGKRWKTFTDKEKQPFTEMYQADKLRYADELVLYNRAMEAARNIAEELLGGDASSPGVNAAVTNRSKEPAGSTRCKKPKRPRRAYEIFTVALRNQLRAADPTDTVLSQSAPVFNKMASAWWNELTEQDKQPFVCQSESDKQRHASEMSAFTEDVKATRKAADELRRKGSNPGGSSVKVNIPNRPKKQGKQKKQAKLTGTNADLRKLKRPNELAMKPLAKKSSSTKAPRVRGNVEAKAAAVARAPSAGGARFKRPHRKAPAGKEWSTTSGRWVSSMVRQPAVRSSSCASPAPEMFINDALSVDDDEKGPNDANDYTDGGHGDGEHDWDRYDDADDADSDFGLEEEGEEGETEDENEGAGVERSGSENGDASSGIGDYQTMMSDVKRNNGMFFGCWNKRAYEDMVRIIKPCLAPTAKLPTTFLGSRFPLNLQFDSVFKLFQLLTTVKDHAVIYSDPAGTGKSGVVMMLLTVLKCMGLSENEEGGVRQCIGPKAPAIMMCPIAVFEHWYRESLLCQGPTFAEGGAQPKGCVNICFIEDVKGLATIDLDQGPQDVYVIANSLTNRKTTGATDARKLMRWIGSKRPSMVVIDEAHTLATVVGTKHGDPIPVMTKFLVDIRTRVPGIWALAISADPGWENPSSDQGGISNMTRLFKKAMGMKGDLSGRIVANECHAYAEYMPKIIHHEIGPIGLDAGELKRIADRVGSQNTSAKLRHNQAFKTALPFDLAATALNSMLKQHPGEQFAIYGLLDPVRDELMKRMADEGIQTLGFARFKHLKGPHAAHDKFADAIKNTCNQVIFAPQRTYERGVNDLENIPHVVFWDQSHRQYRNPGTRNQVIHRHRRLSSQHAEVHIWNFGYNSSGACHPYGKLLKYQQTYKGDTKLFGRLAWKMLKEIVRENMDMPVPGFGRSYGDSDSVEPETPRSKINAVAAQASSGDAGSSGSSAWASSSARGHDVGGGIPKRQKLQSSVADAAGQSLSPLAPSLRLPASDLPMLARFLRVTGIGPGHIRNVLDLADRVGIETPQDFAEMSEQELVVQGFKVLHARKILRALAPI